MWLPDIITSLKGHSVISNLLFVMIFLLSLHIWRELPHFSYSLIWQERPAFVTEISCLTTTEWEKYTVFEVLNPAQKKSSFSLYADIWYHNRIIESLNISLNGWTFSSFHYSHLLIFGILPFLLFMELMERGCCCFSQCIWNCTQLLG